mmetsp:Transcript_24814/g.60394  ORF Transcript_24814/g.60394 Transcript_24814/m.60394 type:complete len:209 (-) Transcript_24814:42-668(-)
MPPLRGLPRTADGLNPAWWYVRNEVVLLGVGTLASPWVLRALDGGGGAVSTADAAALLPFVAVLALHVAFAVVSTSASDARHYVRVSPPTQYVYKQHDGDDAVVLATGDNAAGAFNRAQRARAHMVDALPLLVLKFVVVHTVAPRSAVWLTVAWSAARVLFALGYRRQPQLRFVGFVLGEWLVAYALNGIVAQCALRALGAWPSSVPS